MTPREFRELPTNKKAHRLVMLYFKGQCFNHGRPTKDYFTLRGAFLKAKEADLTDMYAYLLSTEDRPVLKELWSKCHQWNLEQIQDHKVSDYDRISVNEL